MNTRRQIWVIAWFIILGGSCMIIKADHHDFFDDCPKSGTMTYKIARARNACQGRTEYHCLYNGQGEKKTFCQVPTFCGPGTFPLASNNSTILCTQCPGDFYQDHGVMSDRSNRCQYKVSEPCENVTNHGSSYGMLQCRDPSPAHDRGCMCNFTRSEVMENLDEYKGSCVSPDHNVFYCKTIPCAIDGQERDPSGHCVKKYRRVTEGVENPVTNTTATTMTGNGKNKTLEIWIPADVAACILVLIGICFMRPCKKKHSAVLTERKEENKESDDEVGKLIKVVKVEDTPSADKRQNGIQCQRSVQNGVVYGGASISEENSQGANSVDKETFIDNNGKESTLV